MTPDERAEGLLASHLDEPGIDSWKSVGQMSVPSRYVPGVSFEVSAIDSYVILEEGTVPTHACVRVHWPLFRPTSAGDGGPWWSELVDLAPCSSDQQDVLRSFVAPGVIFGLCLWFLGPSMPSADEAFGYRLMLETNEAALWTAGLTHWTWQPARLPLHLSSPLMPPIDRDRRESPSTRRFFEWRLGGHTYLTRQGLREDGWVTPRTIRHLMTQGFIKQEVSSAVGLDHRIDLYWEAALRVGK